MSRRTDVLNKYPAPRVSVVNQSVRPFAGFAGVLLLTTKTKTTETTTTTTKTTTTTTARVYVRVRPA
jgi:hypothetical protein